MQSKFYYLKSQLTTNYYFHLLFCQENMSFYQQIKFFFYLNCIKLWERKMQDAIQIINLKLILTTIKYYFHLLFCQEKIISIMKIACDT